MVQLVIPLDVFVHSIVMGFWPLYTMRRGIYIFTLGCVHIRLCTFIITYIVVYSNLFLLSVFQAMSRAHQVVDMTQPRL